MPFRIFLPGGRYFLFFLLYHIPRAFGKQKYFSEKKFFSSFQIYLFILQKAETFSLPRSFLRVFEYREEFPKARNFIIGHHGGFIRAPVGVQPTAVYSRAFRARDIRI